MATVSIRELSRNASSVAAVARSGRLTLVTRHGALVAAVVPIDENDLEDLVLRYRRMRVAHVLPARDHAEGDGDVVVPLRKPGRPSRGGGAG